MVQTGKQILCAALSLVMALSLAACGNGDGEKDGGPLLYLTFDEGRGNQVEDSAGKAQPAQVNHLFTNAVYSDSREPEW